MPYNRESKECTFQWTGSQLAYPAEDLTMLSRRNFLQTIPAIASVPILAKTGDAFVAHPEWIDAHVHVWTPIRKSIR